MATNPTTDLTEEDAADLQFPKECMQMTYSMPMKECSYPSSDNSSSIDFDPTAQTCGICLDISRLCSCCKCAKCKISLQVPFIECSECENVNLCCRCFANGSDFRTHKSDHNYRVLNHDFILFEKSNWTAAEELVMLDCLYTYGYGNWEMIAKKIANRSESEVKDHYDRFYIDNPASKMLPKVTETVQSLFPKPIIPYKYRVTDIEEPPRHAPFTIGYQLLAGYNAARSDFETEYDARAEQLLDELRKVDIEFSDMHTDILTELQCCILRNYNRRLRERQRRKNVIKRHGLILMRKTMSWMHRYDKTLTRNITERMLSFMQFLTGFEFDFLIEGLHRGAELKQKISRLCDYRRRGITTMQAADVYENLNAERENHEKELTSFTSNPNFNWKNLRSSSMYRGSPTSRRAQCRPLDIIGMPGFEKLSPQEKQLCANVRLVPQTYFELRDLLVAEHKKIGHLKLQTARKLLKIDVNKTRKLFDFLIEEGYIVKSNS